MPLRGPLAAFGSAALLLLAGGCGGEEGKPVAPDTIVRASAATAKRGGYHVVMHGTIRVRAGDDKASAPISAAGDVSKRPYRGDYTVDLSAFAAAPSPGSRRRRAGCARSSSACARRTAGRCRACTGRPSTSWC